jgi:HSP20 family protein
VAKLMKAETPRLAPLREKLTEMPHLMDKLDEMFMERWAPLWSALRSPEEMAARLPPVDIFEEGADVVVKCEVPGMKKEELTVEVGPETITISGRKSKEEKVERRSYYRFERASGMFTRTVRLPCEVELEKAHSTYREGVLEVRVPKVVGTKPTAKKVEIG